MFRFFYDCYQEEGKNARKRKERRNQDDKRTQKATLVVYSLVSHNCAPVMLSCLIYMVHRDVSMYVHFSFFFSFLFFSLLFFCFISHRVHRECLSYFFILLVCHRRSSYKQLLLLFALTLSLLSSSLLFYLIF